MSDASSPSALWERLSGPLLEEVYAAVAPAYPSEGCGFVFEDEAGALRVLPADNLAKGRGGVDVDGGVRTAADWFEPDMRPWLRAERAGWTARVIFHSHPDVGAYFSKSDRAMALFPDDDGTLLERNPGVLHLVVSVRQGVADGAALFGFDEALRDFVELARR